MHPHLARIRLYPLKSLDPVEVDEAVALRAGGLTHDREYCLRDQQGIVLNAKRLGEDLIAIRSEFHFGLGEVVLRANGESSLFRLIQDRAQLEQWFSERLGQPVTLSHDDAGGFPDDDEAAGPTLVSTATLEETATWFPGMTPEEIRRRFRPNLEIAGVPAFWEDRLFGGRAGKVPFRIGDVAMEGIKPCARCTVPPRDSFTGRINDTSFAKVFAERRAKSLPAWADRGCFDHFYRLTTNTKIPESEAGKILQVGDLVIL